MGLGRLTAVPRNPKANVPANTSPLRLESHALLFVNHVAAKAMIFAGRLRDNAFSS